MILANKKKLPKLGKCGSVRPVKQGFLFSWPNIFCFLLFFVKMANKGALSQNGFCRLPCSLWWMVTDISCKCRPLLKFVQQETQLINFIFFTCVCTWQAFHLTEKEHNNPGFLSKSFLSFILFNVLLYILLIAQFIATEIATDNLDYLVQFFNGCFASLMVVVLVFFLAYGVEVFFKVNFALFYV